MSVKLHEAFCFDSFQDRLLWFDDFHGDQLQDEWRSAGSAGGSAVVVDAQTGGIVRITTHTDDDDSWQIDWNNVRSLLVSKKVTMEFRLKTLSAASLRVVAGLLFDTNDNVVFTFDTDAAQTNWYVHTESGGQTELDSGIAVDTSYHIFRIECFPTGQVHYYIDGVETANSPITTNITAQYLQPFFFLMTRTTAAKSMDTDYCYIRQER